MESRELFRKQAIDRKYFRLPGEISVSIPRTLSLLTYAFFASAVVATVIILFTDFSGKERVNGRLVPSLGFVKVSSGMQGILEELPVSAGQHVVRDQRLARIASESAQFGGRLAIEQQIQTAIQSSKEIDHQLGQEEANYLIRSNRLMATQKNLQMQIQAQQAEADLRKDIVNSLMKEVEVGRNLLAKQILSQKELSTRENTLRNAKLQLSELNRATITLKSELEQNHADINAAPRELGLVVSRLKFQKLAIDEKLLGLRSQIHFELLAPTSGSVDFIAQQVGQAVGPETPLFSIIPDGAVMQGELYVPVKSITSIKAGQILRIAYDAFPASRFGYASAKIINVNQTLLDGKDYGTDLRTPVYRIAAKLDRQDFPVNGEEIALRAGISFTADIVVERHALWVWIVKYLGESWHAR